jgi:DNA topoisomerase III
MPIQRNLRIRRTHSEPKPVSSAQLLHAKRIAQGKGLIIPNEAKASWATISAWIDSNRSTKRRKRSRKIAYKARWFSCA